MSGAHLSENFTGDSNDQVAETGDLPVNAPKLTAKLAKIASDRLDDCCVDAWCEHPHFDDAHPSFNFSMDPPLALIPAAQHERLMNNLTSIRDREALAAVLFDWEFLEDHGDELYNVVKALNREFDEMHEATKQERAGKARQDFNLDKGLSRSHTSETAEDNDVQAVCTSGPSAH
ncbi:hypothetical protein OF83DRAFT_1169764 [Amylostereum chailletii]|nr:hypothetical protein OF83DRAFT_1169764 [Amylostereum chailletii]